MFFLLTEIKEMGGGFRDNVKGGEESPKSMAAMARVGKGQTQNDVPMIQQFSLSRGFKMLTPGEVGETIALQRQS